MLRDTIKLNSVTLSGRDGRKVRQTIIPRSLLIITMVAIGSAGLSQPAFADSYLDALQSEASELEVLGKAREERKKLQQTIKKQAKAEKTQPKPKQPVTSRKSHKQFSTADLKQFESALREKFPMSYAVYIQLSPKDKNTVTNTFFSSKRTGLIRYLAVLTKIMDMSVDK